MPNEVCTEKVADISIGLLIGPSVLRHADCVILLKRQAAFWVLPAPRSFDFVFDVSYVARDFINALVKASVVNGLLLCD